MKSRGTSRLQKQNYDHESLNSLTIPTHSNKHFHSQRIATKGNYKKRSDVRSVIRRNIFCHWRLFLLVQFVLFFLLWSLKSITVVFIRNQKLVGEQSHGSVELVLVTKLENKCVMNTKHSDSHTINPNYAIQYDFPDKGLPTNIDERNPRHINRHYIDLPASNHGDESNSHHIDRRDKVLPSNKHKRNSRHSTTNRRWDGKSCAISHKYKFVYIHVLKSGGSTTKEFLRKSFCGVDDPHCLSLEDTELIQPISCGEVRSKRELQSDYFYWSFVRNPFSRAFSMYSMAKGAYPKNANVTTDYTFDNFILNPKERSKYTNLSPSHYDPQTGFLFNSHNCPLVDFIGRVENFDQDMNILLTKYIRNATEMMHLFYDVQNSTVGLVNTWGRNEKKNHLQDGNLKYAYRSKNVHESVVDVYRADFELLGYDTSFDAIPMK